MSWVGPPLSLPHGSSSPQTNHPRNLWCSLPPPDDTPARPTRLRFRYRRRPRWNRLLHHRPWLHISALLQLAPPRPLQLAGRRVPCSSRAATRPGVPPPRPGAPTAAQGCRQAEWQIVAALGAADHRGAHGWGKRRGTRAQSSRSLSRVRLESSPEGRRGAIVHVSILALAIIFTFGHPVGLGLLLSSSCVVYAVAALPKRSEIAVAPSSSRADTAAAVPSKTESAVAALLVSWWFVDAILPLPSTRESAAAAATTVSWFLICMLFANNPVASR